VQGWLSGESFLWMVLCDLQYSSASAATFSNLTKGLFGKTGIFSSSLILDRFFY